MITHFGEYDLIELPSPATYTPAGGIVTTRRVRMLKTTVPAYTAGLAAAGYGWELSPDDNTPYAVVTTIASPDLTITWTLDGNDTEQSIWQSPPVQALFNLIPNLKARAAIRDDIERLVRGEYADDERKTVDTIVEVATSLATGQPEENDPEVRANVREIINGIIRSLLLGNESRAIATFVLRKTQILPPLTNVSPGFQNANKVFTLPLLVRDEPTIPINLSQELTSLGGYWQKKTPQASQSTDGRWTYTVEYWHADRINPFLVEMAQ